MRALLSRVGLNELLDFVHLRHSALPDPALSILTFNTSDAAGRFNSPQHKLALAARGSQHSSNISTQANLLLGRESR